MESPILWNKLHHNPFKDFVGAEERAVESGQGSLIPEGSKL